MAVTVCSHVAMDDGSLVSHEHALPGSCQHSSDTFLLCGELPRSAAAWSHEALVMHALQVREHLLVILHMFQLHMLWTPGWASLCAQRRQTQCAEHGLPREVAQAPARGPQLESLRLQTTPCPSTAALLSTAPLSSGPAHRAGADGGGALGAQLGQAAAEFGFGAVSVAAGASYLRRLAAADAEVRALAGACPGYARLFAPAASLPGAALWLTPPAVPARPPHATVACVPLADWCAARLPGMRWGPLMVQGACEQHATVVPEHASCEACMHVFRFAA